MTGDSLKTERNINKRINLFYPLPVNLFFPFPFSILPSSSFLRPERLGRHARVLLEKTPEERLVRKAVLLGNLLERQVRRLQRHLQLQYQETVYETLGSRLPYLLGYAGKIARRDAQLFGIKRDISLRTAQCVCARLMNFFL